MLRGANCLLLDEPTNHLDIESVEMLEGALERFEGTAVFVSHDRYFLDRMADRILEVAAATCAPRGRLVVLAAGRGADRGTGLETPTNPVTVPSGDRVARQRAFEPGPRSRPCAGRARWAAVP